MDVKLSVIFITYNHEKYVEKALRSVLNQETDFPFEVVIGEDVSTDSTREIVTRIAKEYPDDPNARVRVRLNLRKENTKHPTLNVYETTMMCKGDYLAYLEGDDYWSDVHKLQKQMDFLTSHPEYIGVTHSCKLIDENDNEITDRKTREVGDLYDWPKGDFTYDDFCYSGKWAGHYASLVSKNIYKEGRFDYTILYRAHDFVDDALILLFLLMQGKLYRMDEEMSVWRYVNKEDGGNWNSLAKARNLLRENCYLSKTMMQWMEKEYKLTIYSEYRAREDFGLALKDYIKHPCRDNKKFLEDMYDYGITHVVLKDEKSSLFKYSVKTIIAKLSGKE